MVCENLLNLSKESQNETVINNRQKSNTSYIPKRRINWHKAASYAAQIISKNIAHIFKTYNLFTIKGFSSSITINDYYATFGYACLFVSHLCNLCMKQYSSSDITITLLTYRYPRKLMNHLQNERKLTINKISHGIYHINEYTLKAQIIVVNQLSHDENPYLHCIID